EVIVTATVLGIGAGIENGGQRAVEDVQVEVRGCRPRREVVVLRPDQYHWCLGVAEFDPQGLSTVAEIVGRSGAGQYRQRAVGVEVALPGAGGEVDAVAFVAGRGQVGHAGSGNRVDGLRDRTVLERRLGQVDDVIDDHVAAAGGQVKDVLRELRLVGQRGGEAQRRVRGQVVDDLQHRRAFAAAALLARQHVDGRRQVATGLQVHQ